MHWLNHLIIVLFVVLNAGMVIYVWNRSFRKIPDIITGGNQIVIFLMAGFLSLLWPLYFLVKLIRNIEEEKDTCVLCKAETEYTRNTPIEKRRYYVEGAGQLCVRCGEMFKD